MSRNNRQQRREKHRSVRRVALSLQDNLSNATVLSEAYRPPTNALERAVWQSLMDDGYLVLKRGWPDLAVIDPRSQKLVAVEVKSETDRIRSAQHVVLETLARSHVPTYVYKEGEGFVPVGNSPDWRSVNNGKATVWGEDGPPEA